MLKLPKDLVADPRHDAVLKLLSAGGEVLWEKGLNPVITLPMNPVLAAELKRSFALGFASQGIEQIEKQLAREQKGLDALNAQKPEQAQNARISRILMMANDGSERFYRDCDSALSRYKHRILGIKISLGGEELGQAIFGSPRLVRALLVYDKKAASTVLLSLKS